MLIENVDYFVRVVQFPNGANKGIVCANDDGTFDVYLNSRYTDLMDGYDHEVNHLLLNHFESLKPLKAIEAEADGKLVPQPIATTPDVQNIPCFASLEQFREYLVKTYRPPFQEEILEWLCELA